MSNELDLSKIVFANFPESQYVKERTDKRQVCLHHTVSGQGAEGDLKWWLSTAEKVATTFVVDWKGVIYQCFDVDFWGWHLGVDEQTFYKNGLPYKRLDPNCIGIEIDAMGGLTQGPNGKWYPTGWDKVARKVIPLTGYKPIENVILYDKPFRGFTAFERYTDEQIETVRRMLLHWNGKFGIPLDYNEDMWDISKRALSGEPGIFAHTSYRYDKSDAHPQPELIQMLKGLK